MPDVSKFVQLDGNLTSGSISSIESDSDSSDVDDNDEEDDSEYKTEDEVDSTFHPPILTPVENQIFSPTKPIQLEVLPQNQEKSASLPLCMVLTAQEFIQQM